MLYNLIQEPTGSTYRKIIEASISYCDSILLVIRPTLEQNPSLENTISEFIPYLIEKTNTSEWPGTKLTNKKAIVYNFKLNDQVVKLLKKTTPSLYSWIQPDYPEDLVLLRPSGEPWLTTITHEKDGYLLLSEEEKDKLIKDIPDLKLEQQS